MTMLLRPFLVAGLALVAFPLAMEGQIRASERSTVTQTVDGTTISVDYARPRVRGRRAVFGEEVHWGEVWTPGANMATTLEVSRNVQINGHPVAKGKYSVWMTVEKGDWTVLLDTVVERFHTIRPNPDSVAVRFALRPEQRPRMEVLSWWFPDVRSDGTVLAMQWDTVYVPLRIKVEPTYSMNIAAGVARPLVGSYEMRWSPEPPDTTMAAADSSKHEPEAEGGDEGPVRVELTYDRGSLWGKVNPAPFPGYDTMVLLRVTDEWYIPAWWKDGELYDASDDMVMEFTLENGRATGFDLRMKDDMVIATAKRLP